ncbi:DNA polymerase III subunit epsilon [Paracoccus sp. MC1862]|uniref:DNA polymerase III subunit epsilon n=1 Tax=Paracoccus sp. MC1862 TaxID=2760307 RepID=UPI001601E580|nr:DNA polymerase III subunit epsilon [Paracoccus sp. MC1862]MBB1497942.1 DNA polymerase III subunit epsilon [Paracoccus sp. MC1862]QQO44329.1 DNA polymerase III subunit epsilon [Paracoccus sp. MC1862]
MREIVLDTETTGFDPDTGDRIVEIGAVELMNHLPTGRHFHVYINPERDMPADAFAVHGLSTEFLSDKPRFGEVAAGFIAFIGDARLVIHNAAFDMKFLNAELRRAGQPTMPMSRALDTVAMARGKFPGAPVSLDALCRRWGIDNSNRTLHGALLDSQLLAEVYLELIGGRQPDLVLVPQADTRTADGAASGPVRPRAPRPAPLPPRITAAERQAHAAFVERIGAKALWSRHAPAG